MNRRKRKKNKMCIYFELLLVANAYQISLGVVLIRRRKVQAFSVHNQPFFILRKSRDEKEKNWFFGSVRASSTYIDRPVEKRSSKQKPRYRKTCIPLPSLRPLSWSPDYSSLQEEKATWATDPWPYLRLSLRCFFSSFRLVCFSAAASSF